MDSDPKTPSFRPDDPPWLEHLRSGGADHLDLYWVARAMLSFRTRFLRWPARNELYSRLNHRYPDATAMEGSLDTLNAAWDLRRFGELDCDARCGHPVYRFAVKNTRGPATVIYGLNPFRDVVDPMPAKPMQRGVFPVVPCGEAEVTAWHDVAAASLHLDPTFQPDRDIARRIKHLELKGFAR